MIKKNKFLLFPKENTKVQQRNSRNDCIVALSNAFNY
jgi:hypothetical protein